MTDRALSIELNITEACNLDCLYCYLQSGKKTADQKNRMNTKVADDLICRYIEQAEGIDFLNLSFWGGEPLLNFKIIQYIVNKTQKHKDKFRKIRYTVVTNGTLINHKIATYCKEKNIELQISIDGDKDCHDTQRVFKGKKGTFDVISSNIDILKKIRVDYSVKTTLTARSPSICEIARELKKIGVNDVFFGAVTPVTNYDHENLSPINAERNAAEIFEVYMNEKHNNLYHCKNIEKSIKYFFSASPRKSCGVSRNKFAIKYDGTIYPCHRMIDSSEFCIGDIWNNHDERYEKLYKNVIKENENCKICEYRHFCGGSCLYEVLKRNDINFVQKDICDFNKRMLFLVFKALTNYYLDYKNNHLSTPRKHAGDGLDVFSVVSGFAVKSSGAIMNNDILLVKSVAANCIDLEEEGILYLTSHFEKKYIVNATAMAVWDLIDGTRTAQEITQEIANVCEVKFDAIKDDIYNQLTVFQELGLVEEVSAVGHA
jgi:uncharacterized protein